MTLSARCIALSLLASLLVSLACSDYGVVGGQCLPGWVERAGACVESASIGGKGGADGGGDAGSAGSAADAGGAGYAGIGGGPVDAGRDSPSDAPADHTGDGCTPPYNTSSHCGDCNAACPSAAPICALMDGEYKCIPHCTEPLVQCGSECVDTNSDPQHCGACFNVCPSGICQAGQCVGATTGHIVLACMSFEQSVSSSAQTVVLGNAVFLPPKNPVRILAFDQYAAVNVKNKLDQTIQWAAQAKGRSYDLVHASSSAQVVDTLNVIDFDVFLVYEQTKAPAGALGTLGNAWFTTLAAFVKAGGIVFVSSGGNAPEMAKLIDGAGLLPVTGHTLITGATAHNVAPTDAIGVNVVSPFLSLKQTCTFETPAAPGPSTVFVVTDSATPGAGAPVVVHRVP